MKQTSRIISTYSADVMGVCSALFELGGMVIMHDASGCNSTYTTHDEPRWYDMDSMVYISALTEMEAIMGDDEKLLSDIETAVAELDPKFVAIAGTPIPTMTGFDFESVASLAEQRTGIPCMGFATTGMNTYINGASMAFEELARRFVKPPQNPVRGDNKEDVKSKVGIDTKGDVENKSQAIKVNILGLTPLDFSIKGQAESIKSWLEDAGFEVISTWSMGCTLADIEGSAEADVNLVVSAAGVAVAEYMEETFGIPYIASLPIGDIWSRELEYELEHFEDIENGGVMYKDILMDSYADKNPLGSGSIIIIGEGVTSLALASAIECETGMETIVFCATEPMGIEMRARDRVTPDEDDIIEGFSEILGNDGIRNTTEKHGIDEVVGISAIIADPLHQPICPPEAKFIRLPSEAFSGRLYRDEIPNLIEEFEDWRYHLTNENAFQ